METMEAVLKRVVGKGFVTLIIDGKRQYAKVMEVRSDGAVMLNEFDKGGDMVVPITSITRVSPTGGT